MIKTFDTIEELDQAINSINSTSDYLNPIKVKVPTRYFYLIQDNLERIKVGITEDVPRRLNQIKRATGLKITRVYYEENPNAEDIEQYLLNKFEDNRIDGTEWLENVEFEYIFDCLGEHFVKFA